MRALYLTPLTAIAIVSACSSFDTTNDPPAEDSGAPDVIDSSPGTDTGPTDGGTCRDASLFCQTFDEHLNDWIFPKENQTPPYLVPAPMGKALHAELSSGTGEARSYVQRLLNEPNRLRIVVDFKVINPNVTAPATTGCAIVSVAHNKVDGGEAGPQLAGANIVLLPKEESTNIQVQTLSGLAGASPSSAPLSVPYDTWQTLTFEMDLGPNGSYRLALLGGGTVEDSFPSVEGEPGLAIGLIRFTGTLPRVAVEFDNLVVDKLP